MKLNSGAERVLLSWGGGHQAEQWGRLALTALLRACLGARKRSQGGRHSGGGTQRRAEAEPKPGSRAAFRHLQDSWTPVPGLPLTRGRSRAEGRGGGSRSPTLQQPPTQAATSIPPASQPHSDGSFLRWKRGGATVPLSRASVGGKEQARDTRRILLLGRRSRFRAS